MQTNEPGSDKPYLHIYSCTPTNKLQYGIHGAPAGTVMSKTQDPLKKCCGECVVTVRKTRGVPSSNSLFARKRICNQATLLTTMRVQCPLSVLVRSHLGDLSYGLLDLLD